VLVVLASSVGLGEDGPFAQLVGERPQKPLLRVEAPAIADGRGEGERAPLAAPEPSPEQAGVSEHGGQEEPSPPDEKASEPESQQPTVQAAAHKETAPPTPKPPPQPTQRQEPETVAVPDLTGMSMAEAEVALAEVSLILRIASYARSNDVPEGVILYQDAPPGYEAYPGATVAVTVSSGSPPAPEEPEEVEPVELLGEKVASKGVPLGDHGAERGGVREKASPEKRDRNPSKEDRPGAKQERPAIEKGPPHEGQRHASSEGANDRGKGGGGQGDGGKEDRGDRGGRQRR
jgi:hypothetical protein